MVGALAGWETGPQVKREKQQNSSGYNKVQGGRCSARDRMERVERKRLGWVPEASGWQGLASMLRTSTLDSNPPWQSWWSGAINTKKLALSGMIRWVLVAILGSYFGRLLRIWFRGMNVASWPCRQTFTRPPIQWATKSQPQAWPGVLSPWAIVLWDQPVISTGRRGVQFEVLLGQDGPFGCNHGIHIDHEKVC